MIEEAFGKPGLPPNWPPASKQGVGTARNERSKVWFTIANGIITEVYYPTVDSANLRDLQFLVADGSTFFHEEKRDTSSQIDYLHLKALAYRITSTAKDGRYRITKEVVVDPGSQSLVLQTPLKPWKAILWITNSISS